MIYLLNYANKWDFMKIVQSVKDTGASSQEDYIRDKHLLLVVPTNSTFVGEM